MPMPAYRCVYCAGRTVRIIRDDDGCRVWCDNCRHLWETDDATMEDKPALHGFATRGLLSPPT